MTYCLFYTDFEVSKAIFTAQKASLTSYRYNELDDALGKARQIKSYGGVPWEIESEDGTVKFTRDQIDKLLHERAP
jgi:hypothetical protein